MRENGKIDIPSGAALCCLRNIFVRSCCVFFPFVLFFILFLARHYGPQDVENPFAKNDPTIAQPMDVKYVYLILALLPIGLYIIFWCLLALRLHTKQVAKDNGESIRAQKYLQKLQLEQGNRKNVDEETPLFAMFLHAANTNNVEYIKWCLERGQHPDENDVLGRTALHWVAFSSSTSVADMLIKTGAALMKVDELDKLTPLHYAAFYGSLSVVRLLIEAGADPTVLSKSGINPLQLTELAMLKTATVQPSHRLITKYLRTTMGDKATEPMQNMCGLNVVHMLEKEMKV